MPCQDEHFDLELHLTNHTCTIHYSEEKYMYTSLLLESGISIAQTVEHGAVELYALNATYVALDKIICINVNVFITFNC